MNELIFTLKKEEPKYKKLQSSELYVSELTMQNKYDARIVDTIVKNFDRELLQPLEVSYRDGKYYVIDGKHRLAAIKILEETLGIKIAVPCIIHYGLTEKEEFKTFKNLAENRRKVGNMELYKAAYEAGDEFVTHFVDIIRSVGFIYDFQQTSMNGRIHMTTTPANIYSNLGPAEFKEYLQLLYNTWNGNKDFLSMGFMKGLYLFYNTYRFDIDQEIFIKRLSILTKQELDYFTSANTRKDKSKTVAIKIFQKYNKNKRKYSDHILKEKSFFYMD